MAFKTVVASLCALSACSLVTKFQTGGTPSTQGPSSSSEPASSTSTPAAIPAVAIASTNGKPAYCGTRNYSKYTAADLHRWWDEKDEEKGRYAIHFLVKLHQAMCSSETPAGDRAEIENMRHSLLAELGMSDADTRDLPKLLDYGMSDTFPDYFAFTTEKPSAEGSARASTTSPIDQMDMLVASNNWFYKTRWLVDAWGDSMTESARASYINLCLHNEGYGKKPIEKALNYAWCSDDVKHLDRAKYVQELAALSPELRFTAKFELGMLMRHVAKVEKEIAKDPKLAKIAIEMPRKIGDDWRAFTKANRSLVDHVRTVELAWIDEGHAADDCRATLAADWKHAIAATPVEKTLAPSQSVAQTSRANYLASVGMSRCAAGTKGFEGLASELDESIARAPLGRGPRTEAFEAAYVALSKDSRDHLDSPRMESVDVSFLPISQVNGHTPRFHAHTVTAAVRHGDKLELKFKKEKVDYAVCTREEPTGNWIIRGNVLERETHCVALKAESMMEEVQPIEVPADLMTWVKPGNAVVLGTGEFPIEIWSDVHQTKLIGLYGTNRG